MFFSPPRRKPNKNQTRPTDNTVKSLTSNNLNQATTMDQTDRLIENNGGNTADESNPNVGSLIETSLTNIPLHIGRGRGSRTPTPTLLTLQGTTAINHMFETVNSRMDILEERLAAVNTLQNSVDTLLTKFNEVLKLQTLINDCANSNRRNIDQEHKFDDESGTSSDGSRFSECRGNLPKSEITNSQLKAYASYKNFYHRENFEPINDSNNRQNIVTHERDLIEKETRRVHFQADNFPIDRSNSVAGERQNITSKKAPLSQTYKSIDLGIGNSFTSEVASRMMKLTVGQPLPDGQIVNKDMLLTESQYNLLIQNANSILSQTGPVETQRTQQDAIRDDACDWSRGRSLGAFGCPPGIPCERGSSLVRPRGDKRRSDRSRRGALSWRTSDSSDDDGTNYPSNNYGSFSRPNSRYDRDRCSPTGIHNYENSIAFKIGRIVSGWKITFPKTEKDPEQFLLILKDYLNTSGIHKDLFVPCLSKIFEGPYRSWYLVNKRSWQTWKDFSKAFRFQWGVKKADGDLFVEIRDLKIEKGESLAEFACRARLIFERMRRPPEFREQLKQILSKFNPRLAFEILNLSLRNYDEFLHYINERNYLYRRSVETQNSCSKSKKRESELNYTQSQFNSIEENDDDQPNLDDDSYSDIDERAVSLKAMNQKVKSKKTQNLPSSKTLTRQRLEHSLERFDKTEKQNESPTPQSEKARNSYSKSSFDQSKMFCYNCGQMGHATRFCTAARQTVCLACRKISHDNLNCSKAQGNAESPQ